MYATIACAGRRQNTLEQDDALHQHRRMCAHRPRHPRERLHSLDGQWAAYTRQRDVRPERPPLYLEPCVLARELEIVMQQFQPALLLYPDPYDACPSKVRKRPDLVNGHLQRPVSLRGAIRGLRETRQRIVGDVAEELQREMTLLAVDPRQLGRFGAQLRRRLVEQILD